MTRMLSGTAVWLWLALAILALPFPAIAASVTATSWVELDGSGTRDGLSRNPTGVRALEHDVSAAMDPDGNPVVAYVDAATGNVIVKQLIDDVWTQLGTTPGQGVEPRVKVASDGTVNVAWRSPTAVLLARWTGVAWVGLAGSDTGTGLTGAVNPVSFGLALDLAGNPIVVFDALPLGASDCVLDGGVGLTGEQVYAVQWDGVAWTYLGSDASGPGASNALSFAIPGAGQSVCHSAIMPTVAVDGSGLPVVIFVYTTSSNDAEGTFFIGTNTDLYAVRWDGGDWVALGPTVPTQPVGPGLGEAGGLSNNANASALPGSGVPPAMPSVAIGDDNRPVVAWSDNSTDPDQTRIFVRKFSEDVRSFNVTTASWLLIGTASATGMGISPLTGNNTAPQVAIGKLQQPRIAWTTIGTTGRPTVYVKRLGMGTGNTSTVTTWVEETVGSASATGINGTSVDGGAAAVAIDPDSTAGPVVAWLARGLSAPQVFARQMAAGITATVTVTVTGSGTGTVTSQPLGISCPTLAGGCSQVFPIGTVISLTATPDPNLAFGGWSGACTGLTNPCVFTLTAAGKTATATFTGAKLTVVRASNGAGVLVSSPAGISCGLDCTQAFPVSPTPVTVTATPFRGSTFVGWSGCGAVSGPGNVECQVVMNTARTITATFSTAFLIVSKTGSGTGTVTGLDPGGNATSAPINCGSICTSSNALTTTLQLTATPDQGSTFAGWSGCTFPSGNTCSVMLTSAGTRTVTATFTTAKLTVMRGGTGTGTVTGTANPGTSTPINCGAVCTGNNATGTTLTLTAAPAPDSAFTSWSGCTSANGSSCTVLMNTSKIVTANFTSLPLTVNRAGTGTGTVTGPGIDCGTTCTQKFPPNTSVRLQANNTDPASAFTSWSGCTSTNGSTCTVLMASARAVTATFTSHKLTVTLTGVGGGSGTVTGVGNPINCSGTGLGCLAGFPPGTAVTLTATPAQGAVFTRWSGCTPANVSTCTVLMSTAKTVSATFTSVPLTLTITGTGTVTSDIPGINCAQSCTGRFVQGSTVVLTATPASTSGFMAWTGCTPANVSTCTVLLNTAKSVGVTFLSRRLTVARASVGGGSGTVTGPAFTCGALCFQDFPPNTMVTVTATPDASSGFTGWTGCASTSGPGNTSCNVTMNIAKTVTATFARFNLTVTKSGTGVVQDSTLAINCGSACTAAFAAGTMVTLTATSGPGQGLIGFTGCGSVVGSNCSVVMSQARMVTVKFGAFNLTVTKTGAGTGTITSDTGGIGCPAVCTKAFPAGTTVTLTANPAAGSSFGAFTGCTPVTATTCTVDMTAARSVSGSFTSP